MNISDWQAWLKHPYCLLLTSIIICLYAANISYQTLQLPLLTNTNHSTPTTHLVPDDFNQIASWHVFGKAPMKHLPKTTLQLQLIGIYTGSDETGAQAIITSPSSGEKIYHIGDSIDGALIKNIGTDHIILQHNHRLESLNLPREKLPFNQPPKGF